ncbi:MAG: efflux RND transporter periplasmic adaptor subunit [Luteolibacter sp.]
MNEKLEKDRKTQLRAVISFVLILVILGVVVLGIIILVMNRRVAAVKERERIVPAVEVALIEELAYKVEILTQGVVESSRETKLAAEVSGRVMEISPSLRRGGMVKKGERLVQLDPSDYRSALASAEVAAAEMKLALEQERAKVQQAQLDWKALGSGKPLNPLVLREPYLKAAEAKLASSMEEAARARRDVERTEILAPFDAGVRMASVEVGAVASPGMMVAELYASEDLEVRLPLGLEDFGFLKRNAEGAVEGKVLLKGKIGLEEYEWEARVSRVDPEIDRETLSASVVVQVSKKEDGEFSLPPVGLFVDVVLEGKMLDGVTVIPRRGLLEGDRVIVVGADNTIEFKEVAVVRLNEETAVIGNGLGANERIVLTRLSAPVVGMEVEIQNTGEDAE